MFNKTSKPNSSGQDEQLRSALQQSSRMCQEFNDLSNELALMRTRVYEMERKTECEEIRFLQKEQLLKEKLFIAETESKKFQQLLNNKKDKRAMIEDTKGKIKEKKYYIIDSILTVMGIFNKVQIDLKALQNEASNYQEERLKRDIKFQQKISAMKKEVELKILQSHYGYPGCHHRNRM